MGHLLQTVNPEAAAAIQPIKTASPEELPKIGDIVLFIPRPGEGPGARRSAPMIVNTIHPDGRIGGVVIFDAQDFRDIPGLFQRTPENPMHCWDFARSHEIIEIGQSLVAEIMPIITVLQEQLSTVGARIDALRSQNQAARAELRGINNIEARLARIEKELGFDEPRKKS